MLYSILFKYHFGTAYYLAAVFLHLYMKLVFIRLITEEREFISEITFSHIRHFKPADTFRLIQFYRKQVKYVLDITNTVYVSVNIDITVLCRQRRNRLIACHLDTRRLFYRARFIAYIIDDASSMQCQQIGRLTGIQVRYQQAV